MEKQKLECKPAEHKVVKSIRRMLILVDDHTDIDKFGILTHHGWEIISTGETAEALRRAGIPYIPIEIVTDFPKKTGEEACLLHPEILKGIVADRQNREQMVTLLHQGITPIDMVVVSFRNFSDNPSLCSIDASRMAVIQTAIQNSDSVVIVVRKEDYDVVIRQTLNCGEIFLTVRSFLVWKASLYLLDCLTRITNWTQGEYTRINSSFLAKFNR